ncbi:MAG: DUF4079 domain-containing protein [Alkalinema sp. RU_4_3]|nr:DUF4079 domain-containing protein [Alkalinema sp. RU_4_3]
MALNDWMLLLHPTIAIVTIFPLLGIVLYQALLTRKRRLSLKDGQKTPIPATSGPEHVRLGRILSLSVVAIALLGLAQPIFSKLLASDALSKTPMRFLGLTLVFIVTGAALPLLDRAKNRAFRGLFALLTGGGLLLLGSQPEIFHRDGQWYLSHYYLGITAALLMIFSLVILQEIYRDRTHRWRNVHIILNSFAVLLFIAQGLTGTRDLLEIPLTWQKPHIEALYKQSCQTKPCSVESQK